MYSIHYKKYKKYLKSIFLHVSKSFTLIELMVVISIIGFLSAMVIAPSLNTAKISSRDSRRISDINQIAKAIELYRAYNNTYPLNPSGSGFSVLADSRNSTCTPVPPALIRPYCNLMSFLVPNFLSTELYPPLNGQKDGAMCNNCDEYNYYGKPFGAGYIICTYLAKDPGVVNFNSDGPFYGTNIFGQFYCIASGCGAGTTMGSCT